MVNLKTMFKIIWSILGIIAVFAVVVWLISLKVMADAIGMTAYVNNLFK